VANTGESDGSTAAELTSARAHHARAASRYLVVFGRGSSSVFPLPEEGAVIVGRGAETALRLDDRLASREHARIVADRDGATVVDLGSHNGTFVNDLRARGAVPLVPGDVIAIGESRLVYAGAPRASSRVVPLDRFREHVVSELERAAEFGRAAAVVALAFEGTGLTHEKLEAGLEGELRSIERIAFAGPYEAILLLPERSAEDAERRAHGWLAKLEADSISARAGVAAYPSDTSDADALVAMARAAAGAAKAGDVTRAAQARATILIGEEEVIAADPTMLALFKLLERIAPADLPVLVQGETGSGKELVARALHAWGRARSGRFVSINCAAIPDTLVEAELFGYERGAFSGATTAKPGLVEQASGGTLLLDEVGDLSASAQGKLLRVLETQRFTRLGDVRERDANVRIVAATHRDLAGEASAGRFREDLYFRLAGAVVWVPPLRDRPRELSLLFARFLGRARAKLGRPELGVSDGAMRRLQAHAWPGNVRELRNLAEWFAATVDGAVVDADGVASRLAAARPRRTADEALASAPVSPPPARGQLGPRRSLADEIAELERERIVEALDGALGNQTRAAQAIGMPLRTFVTKMKQHGLGRARGD
jgi:two-component system response regulator AtoC